MRVRARPSISRNPSLSLSFSAGVSSLPPSHRARCRQSDWICPISRVERKKSGEDAPVLKVDTPVRAAYSHVFFTPREHDDTRDATLTNKKRKTPSDRRTPLVLDLIINNRYIAEVVRKKERKKETRSIDSGMLVAARRRCARQGSNYDRLG